MTPEEQLLAILAEPDPTPESVEALCRLVNSQPVEVFGALLNHPELTKWMHPNKAVIRQWSDWKPRHAP